MLPPSPASLVVDAVICARDQADPLAATLAEIPTRLLRSVVVVDNGSRDTTASVARDAGAIVIHAPRGGYGAACRRAIAHLEALPRPPDAVVFLAADGSDDPAEISLLLTPLRIDNAELVVGVRSDRERPGRGRRDRLTRALIAAVYRHRVSDVGPFRAIRFPALVALALQDGGSGFHVEMQIRALKLGLHVVEVPVSARAVGARAPARRRLGRELDRTGRSLFYIVRHATTR
ncbi:glycosyltransferase family 2 protein [Haliangium sp.]|uniref:glycosyltransferase family 2 protein n=1 Tax=Haliangium sp. TaxID=2663208 RepID=UPI003D0D07F2